MEVGFKQVHQKLLQDVEQQIQSRSVRAANVLKKYSNKVLSNAAGRSGKVYRKPGTMSNKGNHYTASAPGEPPALRTGELRRSWRPLPTSEMVAGEKRYHPGLHTDVKYAPMLESGTSKIAARPFQDEIKQQAWPEVKQIFGQPYLK